MTRHNDMMLLLLYASDPSKIKFSVGIEEIKNLLDFRLN